MKTKKYGMTCLQNLHHPLSTRITWAITSRFQSNMLQPALSSNLHHNVIQHASTARYQHVAWWRLHGHAAATNGSISILITWINSFWSIYFNNSWGLHQLHLSASTSPIFTTDFSNKNGTTITIGTKTCETTKFLMQFETELTLLPESSYMTQYFFESMFIYYILQK